MSSQFAGTDTVLQVPNTSLFVQGQDRGRGLLSIDESCLCWTADEEQSDVVTLDYPRISLHAISRDTTTFPHHCLYLLYCPCDEDEEEEESEEEGSPIEKITEMRFVPSSPDDLEQMYSALCECQALYPDSDLSSDSQAEDEGRGFELPGEDESGMFYTSAEEGLSHLSSEGRALLEHLEQVIQLPRPDEFEAMINEEAVGNGCQYEDANEDTGNT